MALQSDKPKRIGLIGLGAMGGALATNLLARKFELHVYNRTPEKTTPFKEKGAIVQYSPAELAPSVEILITCLTDQNAVDVVALGSNGFLNSMNKGALWIDMSTIDPDASLKHYDAAKQAGVNRLDSPISGGPAQAAKGEVMLLVGGSHELFEKYLPFLSEMGKNVVYLGSHASGHKMKLVVNLYMSLIAESFAEVFVLSKKLGFEPKVFVDTINKTNHKNGFTEGKGPRVAEGKFDATFSLNNLLKDIQLASEQANRKGAVLPLAKIALQQYTCASNEGLGQKDFSAIAQEIAKLNGLNL